MTATIEAVYERGVFRPLGQIAVSEGTHVEVTIPTVTTPRDPRPKGRGGSAGPTC
jgi:predicted DNA-binding antitoxin AbrB/MazE fold protein